MAAAGVLIKFGNSILLCKRSSICNYPGHWSIPAGAIEDGETPEQAARRELMEETQIEAGELKFTKKIDGLRSKSRGVEPFYVFTYEPSDIVFPKLDFEHTEFGYFRKEGLPEPMCENILNLIKTILND